MTAQNNGGYSGRRLFRATLSACAAVLLLCGWNDPAPVAFRANEASWPDDIHLWPTLGTTVRTSKDKPEIAAQQRQILMRPDDLAATLAGKAYPDGAVFAAIFYTVSLEEAHTPPLYRADVQVARAMEIIDRDHPDGRRFYIFSNEETRAAALPANNECAACHNAQGSFDGTFAHLYPAIRSRVPAKLAQ